MTFGRDDHEPTEPYDDRSPRSIFAATWFRVVLVLIVLGVVGAVAVPYILDAVNGPMMTKLPTVMRPLPPRAPSTPPPVPPAPVPAPPPTTAEKGPSPPPPTSVPAAPKPAAKPDAVAATVVAKGTPSGPNTAAPRVPAAGATVARATLAPGRVYWVQIGAFKDQATARHIAERLRGEHYSVQESSIPASGVPAVPATTAPSATPASSDQYDVFISGASLDDIKTRLAGKGLSAETSGAAVVVKPSLPLRDAVALSKELAVEGLKVQVRRAGGESRPAAAPASGGATLFRVRVGSFADRAAAQAAAKELEAKGFKPFVARSGS